MDLLVPHPSHIHLHKGKTLKHTTKKNSIEWRQPEHIRVVLPGFCGIPPRRVDDHTILLHWLSGSFEDYWFLVHPSMWLVHLVSPFIYVCVYVVYSFDRQLYINKLSFWRSRFCPAKRNEEYTQDVISETSFEVALWKELLWRNNVN